MKSKNKEGKRMDDVKIIEALFERDECALVELEQRYGRIYRTAVRNVLRDPRDVEECINDTLLAVWNTIPPKRPSSLLAFVSRIARAKAIDKLRYNTREKRDESMSLLLEELEECVADNEEREDECAEILNEFLDGLSIRPRVIFLRRYFYFESVQSIAKRFDMTENAVSVSLFRTREGLRKALIKKGIKI